MMTVWWHHVLLDSARQAPQPSRRSGCCPAVSADVCPGRPVGRLPGRLPGRLDLPGHLPTLAGADAQVSGEIYLFG